MTSARAIGELDLVIGRRIKLARINRGLSQIELAQKLKLSVQMLQRYERGLNRVSASRLRELAEILNCEFEYFVESTEKPFHPPAGPQRSNAPAVREKAGSLPQAMELLNAFSQITDEHLKQQILALVKSIAEQTSFESSVQVQSAIGRRR